MKIQKEWQVAIKNFLPISAVAITAFINDSPELALAMYSAIGCYGIYMDANQEDTNKFIKFIKDNPEAFTATIVKTNEFKKGFVVTFGEYLKSRSRKKREIIQRIFLGFTTEKDKEDFQLEKLYSTLANISLEAIKYLKFIEIEIIPTTKEPPDPNPEKRKRFITEFITEFITKDKKNEDLDKEKHKLNEISSELVSLGIWRNQYYAGSLGKHPVKQEAEFTKFGLDFIKFLDTTSL